MTTTSHSAEHEIRILRNADGDTDAGSNATIAEQVAACDDCLSYVAQTIETLTAIAGDKATRHVSVLDHLMDDVMVLRARAGVRAMRRERVPAGE